MKEGEKHGGGGGGGGRCWKMPCCCCCGNAVCHRHVRAIAMYVPSPILPEQVFQREHHAHAPSTCAQHPPYHYFLHQPGVSPCPTIVAVPTPFQPLFHLPYPPPPPSPTAPLLLQLSHISHLLHSSAAPTAYHPAARAAPTCHASYTPCISRAYASCAHLYSSLLCLVMKGMAWMWGRMMGIGGIWR